ncbi:type IV toxin-antitoxin system AbiEi family antitoxin domain-containing protein [Variovorax sp. NFACC27]|uniref:type IV toxin-antitoxin system AbiEi family antitoxin domain-containing protein n=1 Tax=unclassified Variovorax TaxID=663243 RepID=UPI00089598C6|nr:putative transcriptional regulator of viral defense system [Variovorax paradoxus]SEF35173.1 Transcriptional regulator, AbiEi antitoxin, Type IV TA system [Variovorax sp. NFACC28]SEG98768.1 Transcriptional regulator, AbiEi antitoxin, Type IV TA system [Variovorax sp. NFACC29]SFE14595.1 Transcriptional regulator, AbiEi antitoxin, Type IV TA system [Variovorax sp. NFACC26]SFH19530.1 Transcriptional regulator, AbiEi antitoxin, Type IV TA system [Variovorax sp. NFACC27]
MAPAARIIRLDAYTQRVLDLLACKGILRPKDLDALAVPRSALARLSDAGLLEKVGRGLYGLPERRGFERETWRAVATQVPRAVLCLLSALQFHELTTQPPRQVWIAMPRGSHTPRIGHPPIRMIQACGDAYSAGIDVVEREQVRLRVYGVAKTVADCFKHRNKIGLDVALEALRTARMQQKATVAELWHYAKICRVASVMRPYLEVPG